MFALVMMIIQLDSLQFILVFDQISYLDTKTLHLRHYKLDILNTMTTTNNIIKCAKQK